MDKKLENCLASLRDAAELARGGEYTDLSPYVADLSDICANLVSDDDISFAIANVFDDETGVFSIVESLMPVRDRHVAKARELCLNFLSTFVKKIGGRAHPYAAILKEKCLKVFRRDDAKPVQAAALNPLIAILESSLSKSKVLNLSVDWGLASMLMMEFRKAKTNGTLRAGIIQLLGYLVEYFKASFDDGNVAAVLKLCLDTLEEQLQKPLYVLLAGAVKCLDSVLTWFDDSLPAGGSVENSRRIYMYIEQVLWPREEMKRYDSLKAALRLLSRHAGLFSMRLLEDGLRNLQWLQDYCTHTNASLRDAALPAYDQFMSQISRSLISDSRIRNAQLLYKGFVTDALGILDAEGVDPKKVSLAIRAVGKLAAPIVKFSGKESLREAFHRLQPFGASSRAGEGREEFLGHAVTLVGAFADIVIHLDDVEDFMVAFIAEVAGNIFYQFPQLFPKQKQAVYPTLRSLFKALYLKGAIFTLFLNNIVWSSLQRAMEPMENAPGSGGQQLWQHYVELWSHLLDFEPNLGQQGAVDSEADDISVELAPSDVGDVGINATKLRESMFDAVMHCVIKAMRELNLKYRVKVASSSSPPGYSRRIQDSNLSSCWMATEEGDGGPADPDVEMDVIEPLDSSHMRKYLNLVEFVQGLLSGPYAQLFLQWTYPFGRSVIELSSSYPLISGFYKLLAVTITTADHGGFFSSLNSAESPDMASKSEAGGVLVSEEDRHLCQDLFGKYLQEVLVASRRYKLELLAACLRLCLSAPPVLVGIASLVPSMRNALKFGLRYPPLAAVAMDAVERWQKFFPLKLQEWLPEIVPCLNDYLVDFEETELADSDMLEDSTGGSTSAPSIGNVSRAQLARIKQGRAKEAQPGPFELIQVRVQKFLGRLGGFAHLLVSDVDLLQVAGTGGLAWDPIDRVKFTLPFRDEKPDIWLDSLLSRIVELALSSSDRRTKVTASELLQAVCLLMLGSAAKGPTRRQNEESQSVHYDKLYRRLFPAVLRLATDVELVTRQLFTEFAKQLTHWLTSNQQKENPETMALLDAILDGLVDPESGSLREFCADCFAEFMRWSIRHASPKADNFVNVTSMLRRVYNRMDHPNPYHRLGAAMAAHRIYPVLRENGSIVDRHILEIVFFCIKSLRLGEADDEQIGTVKQMNKTLDLLQRLIQRNIASLQKKRKDRPLFPSLEEFLLWLFNQTGRLQERCRTKCMKLFSSICEALPEGSSGSWFRAHIVPGGRLDEALKPFDVGINYSVPNSTSLEQMQLWLTHLMQSLHWFEWALRKKLITADDLVKCNENSSLKLSSAIFSFLQSLLTSQDANSQLNGSTPGEKANLQNLRFIAVTYLLNFSNEILNSQAGPMATYNNSVLSTFIPAGSSSFQQLLSLVLLRPRDVGFVLSDPQKAQDLAKLAMKVLKRLTEVSLTVKDELVELLQTMVVIDNPAYDLSSLNLSLDKSGKTQGLGLEDAMSLLKGYQQLNQSGILLPVLGKARAVNMGERLLQTVFKLEQDYPPALEPIASEMLSLSLVLGVKVGRLVDLVLDERSVSTMVNNRKLTAGGVFYMNFRKTILQQVKFFYRECLGPLLKAAVGNQTARFLLSAVLEDYLKPSGMGDSITKASFLQEFVQHIQSLSPCCDRTASLTMKQFFLDILHKLLLLDTRKDTVLSCDQSSFTFIIETFLSFLRGTHTEDTNSLYGKSAVFALKTASVSLVPLFFSSSLDKGVRLLLANALTNIVTDHLLVREADMPKGSNQRANYSQMLTQLLGAVSISKSLELLEVLFPLLQNPVKVSTRGVAEALEVFAESFVDDREAAFNLCLGVINDSNKNILLRRSVAENVFGSLVNCAPKEFIASWYAEHISSFFQLIKQRPSVMDAEREQEDLTNKVCHYGLLELLFSKVDTVLIKETINPLVKIAELMKRASDDSRAKNDPTFFPFPENASLWRDLHAAAYSCLAALITCTQEQERYFTIFLFKESSGLIWHHLVDLDKVYDNMPVETAHFGAANQTVKGMRVDRKFGKNRASGSSYGLLGTLSSQYMISGSLSQEPAVINTFVGGQGIVPVASSSLGAGLLLEGEESSSVTEVEGVEQGPNEEIVETTALDGDDFDQHPCMGVVLRLIDHLHSKFGGAQHGSSEMPDWMNYLHATLDNAGTHINVRLFLAKVVTKARRVFAPYAIKWFRPYVQAILIDPKKSGGLSFHYMLRDICISILQWNLSTAPDEGLATKLIQHLIGVAAYGTNQVLRANIDIIRLFLETWKESIRLERSLILRYLIAGGSNPDMNDKMNKMQRAVGLQLLGAVVASGFLLYDPMNDPSASEEHICEALLNNLNVKTKEIYEAAAELLGIAMNHRSEAGGTVKDHILETKLNKTLKQLYRDTEYERFFNILNKVTIRYPKFLEGYSSMVIDQLPRLFGVYKINVLDMLLRYPKSQLNLLNQILPSFSKLLTHRDEIAQLKTLKLLAELLKDVTEDRLNAKILPVLCDTFGGHESGDCRREYYEILMYLYKDKGTTENRLVIRSLLIGLCDRSDVVREGLQRFWHSQLSQDVSKRFTQLVNQVYDPALEEQWAQISNVLLLKLCEDSVDFKRPIFTAPLSDCEFHDYTINTSWMGGSLPMTPLFSNSQMTMDLGSTQSSQGVEGEGGFVATQHRPGMIRATMTPSQSLAFTQTQGGTLNSTQGLSGSALFALGSRPGGSGYSQSTGQEGGALVDPAANLRRRLLNPRVAQLQVLSGVLRANQRREARAAVQALERANKVNMLRQYRTGELPDIQIKHEEILRPLAALAERDQTFARLLLTLLCGAVYSLPSAGPNIRAEVRQGLQAALEQTHNGTSFVGCVEALCLQDPEIWITPKLVGSASRKSTNYHSGIVLLEKEILNETIPEAEAASSNKRHKGRGGQINREVQPLEDAWLELAQLYKSLGEDDIVLALLQRHLVKNEITHRALEAQLGGDSQQAVTLYDEVLGMYEVGALRGDVTQSEKDIWYNQRLACLADLNSWRTILEDTLLEVTDDNSQEPEYNRLWEPPKQDLYLGLVIRGALKVETYHNALSEFIQMSLDDPPKRKFLLDHFGTHLATLAVINGEWDRARFHLGQCYKTFRKGWSALHPLALEGRHIQVRQLQKTVELDEFVTFISDGHCNNLPSLLGEWQKRWPSPELDDVEAWDDILQNRLTFFNKIQKQFNKKQENDDTIGNRGESLVSMLDAERAHLYYEAATGLIQLGAYTVSQNYMKDYMSSRIGFAEKDDQDLEFLKSLMKLRCLQAEKTGSLDKRIEMLQQVLLYIHSEKSKFSKHPHFIQDFKMLEAEVSSKVAWATLAHLPKDLSRHREVEALFSLMGSALKAYSNLLPKETTSGSKTTTLGECSSKDAAKASLKFGLFCDELLKLPKNTKWGDEVREGITRGQPSAGLPKASEYPNLVVRHILKALAFDSTLQSQHAVARLLSLLGQYPETHTEFQSIVGDVSSWVFVGWIPQLLAVMEEEAGSVLVKVLESIAKLYPQALYFAFHVSETDFGAVGKHRTQQLRNLLRNSLLERLVRALEDLTYPEQRLRDAFSRILNLLVDGKYEGAQAIYHEVYQDCLDVQALKNFDRQAGEWNIKFARDWAPRIVQEFGENGSELLAMDPKRFQATMNNFAEQLARSIPGPGKSSLGTLSKWLADFDQSKGLGGGSKDGEVEGNGVEIPGQYNSFHSPEAALHVQLVGFDQTLVCLRSKQRPKILTMRGSDEKDYKFVVKGGEDLRLDQRIEQLFEVMNSVLNQDSACSRRKLSVHTYAVIPISKKCGLLQFVENTCVLEDIIKDGLSSKTPVPQNQGQRPQQTTPHEGLNSLRGQYSDWVQRRGGSKNQNENYSNLYRRADYGEVSQKLSSLQAQLPWDALRMGFSRLATSSESYLALRSHFARSLSVVSICGYVAGVGDRHLANTLVDMRSGALVPIDFGYSFGTNVLLLPVPELVPFRLTAQLTNFLLPLDAIGLLRNDMIRIMGALHSSRDVISAVMEVFVNEPLVDWKQEALRLQRARGTRIGGNVSALENLGANDLQQETNLEQHHVELKVENAHRKLDLWNPAEVTVAELQSSMHANKPYIAALEAIVRGDPQRNARARVCGNVCESVQEQVDCLIDQATDPNLLGRIFAGWQPWV